ncbi:hypothetical protein ACH5RR_000059 [Cinchona calisaya]|uniref:Uncharacterized protein n=1 Tax=Cinchona calisaya TaxID=153742 RepID=A0ABD3AZP3_9GENT
MEPDEASNSTPKLPLFTMATMQSPEHSGMLTPPLYSTSASVPFRWEEEPGKPRPCTTLIPFSTTESSGPKCLDLPPSRLFSAEPMIKIARTPSPTTVLEGPYNVLGSRPKFTSSSFRFFTRDDRRQGSFDSSSSRSLEKGQLISSMVLGKKQLHKRSGLLFGSWRQKTPKLGSGKRDVGGSNGSSVGSNESSIESDESSISGVNKIGRIRRNGSFSSLSQARSHFWAAMYEGFKKVVVPWRSRKSKKGHVV